MTIKIEQIKMPKGARRNRGTIKVSEPLRNAVKAYKAEYKLLYGVTPTLTYTGTYVRVNGGTGVKLQRLKELTTQLRRRRESNG